MTFQQLHDAFRRGDLDALRTAVDDPRLVPNGRMPDGIGSCLVYAIYHSPLAFVRTLLEHGADPNAPADDGFPPLIAALTCTREIPGASMRTDIDELLRLLLAFGADPNQRGINDYTPLHMAVAERSMLAAHILLESGADPDVRTRIDQHETPLEMATAAGLRELASLLEHKGVTPPRRVRAGVMLLLDIPGRGDPVRRQHHYRIRLRMWLRRGEPIRWRTAVTVPGSATIEDEGRTLVTDIRIDRTSLIAGLFYGVDGMRVGGLRRLEIAPHLAYGDHGVPDVIPPGALLLAEISILEPRSRPG
jgi:uncharacterized protein